MGFKYILFRFWYLIKKKSGVLTYIFPTKLKAIHSNNFQDWCNSRHSFFFDDPRKIQQPIDLDVKSISLQAQKILEGDFLFFNALEYKLGSNYDWITNPDTGYKYNISLHWSNIESYDPNIGDIKFVWEKSRFSYVYTLIRDDLYNYNDHSYKIKNDILDWIAKNPLNCGPNYVCSQEISIRILNWTFALHYFKERLAFTEDEWKLVSSSIYWQLHHVYHNINFSLISVRNNHALTETLTLYLIPIFFPWLPNSSKWKKKGKSLFEKEIAYQIYEDGTFLQHSMNYHRVVIQLLTWAIGISNANGESFDELVYERALKSINFLFQCQNDENGFLPNYGNNDGALFFPLNSCQYRDYRPQLNALHVLLTGVDLYIQKGLVQEDSLWLCNDKTIDKGFAKLHKEYGIISFEKGGYYLIREEQCFTFIRCCSFFDRPAQADNLHVDIWYKNQNILIDPGSYKYNTTPELLKQFVSTSSHNTATINEFDQMLKGERFIWYKWIKKIKCQLIETDDEFIFSGNINTNLYLRNNIYHFREVKKSKKLPNWIVTDSFDGLKKGEVISQHWNIHPDSKSSDFLNVLIEGSKTNESVAFYSSEYGVKIPMKRVSFETNKASISTSINFSNQ
jgi:hypothetical protein